MIIKTAQKKVLDALMEKPERLVVHRRSKKSSDATNFGYFVADRDEHDNEIIHFKIQAVTLEAMVNEGMLTLISQSKQDGYTYKISDKMLLNRHLLELSSKKANDSATLEKLRIVAEKFFCKVEYDRPIMLFKVVRLDGKEFSEPYIDTSSNGVKVTQLRDISLTQWQEEIINVIRRSHLVD